MRQLTNKQILLGITGGIAAYKAAELSRLLIDAGADVRVVMTKGGQEFITPLTMQALTGNPVHTTLLDPDAEAGMGHIELARWADLVLVAPASANFMSRLAEGRADDLLTTLCLATQAPIALAPAMNQAMWQNAKTQENLSELQSKGIRIFGPAHGIQACGDVGPGRMLEPSQLLTEVCALFSPGILCGKRVTITAGPTREAIDPVRYISNHSSGKMGYALAEAAVEAGARVTLISGPVALQAPPKVQTLAVISAREMHEAALIAAKDCDIFIATAAVADYRPVQMAEQKIKSTPDQMHIELTRNPDVVASVAALPQKPFTVGFAAETQDVLEYAQGKLARKNLDLIIANDVSQEGIGFNSEDNAVTLVWAQDRLELPRASKRQIARQIIQQIALRCAEEPKTPNAKTTG